MRPNLKAALQIALVAIAFPAMAFAQSTSPISADGGISVVIENEQITLMEDIELNFGTVQPFGTDGTVRIHPNGTTYNINTFNTVNGNPATWSLTGVPTAPFQVTLPTHSITVDNGTETMAVTDFTMSGNTFFDANGNASFNVGATLQVSGAQADGTYSGTYPLTVAY